MLPSKPSLQSWDKIIRPLSIATIYPHLLYSTPEVVTSALPARSYVNSTATRPIGTIPDITNAASWDTVRNAEHTRCLESHSCMILACLVARSHGPGYLGPRVFAIIFKIADVVPLALPLVYARCSLKDSRWSIMTPKYFRLRRDVIMASLILIVAVFTFFLPEHTLFWACVINVNILFCICLNRIYLL